MAAVAPPPSVVPVLEEIKLPPSNYRIRIGEPCSPLIESTVANVDLVVSSAMMKRLRKAPIKLKSEDEDEGPVAYIFALGSNVINPGQKYERIGYHASETGQTAIIDLEAVYNTGDAAAEFEAMQNVELWCRLFQKPRGKGTDAWGCRPRLADVRKKISRSIVFLGDVPLTVTNKANVFIHRDSKTHEIDALVIDTGSVFGAEPPPPPPVLPMAAVLAAAEAAAAAAADAPAAPVEPPQP